MKYESDALIDSLLADIRQIILEANLLNQLPCVRLQRQPSPEKWSAAQVLEHLNCYARHYIFAIEEKLHLHQTTPTVHFHPGWLGNYFTRIMRPGEGNTISNKMKAPKNSLPSEVPDAKKVLDEFIGHQHHLVNLLQLAKTVNLGKIRIPTSLSKIIALKLGDTFRFFIAHEQRHFLQIREILKNIHASNVLCL